MHLFEDALERLDMALDRLETAFEARERRLEAERRELAGALASARQAEVAARGTATEVAKRLDAAIVRLQTVLEE